MLKNGNKANSKQKKRGKIMLTKLIAKYYCLICDEKVTVCNRKDFLIFLGIYLGSFIILMLISSVFDSFNFPGIFYLPLFICFLLLHILLILLSNKRLHDVSISGFFILVPFINIVLLFSPSVEENNKYSINEISKEDEKENDNLEKFIELLEKE